MANNLVAVSQPVLVVVVQQQAHQQGQGLWTLLVVAIQAHPLSILLHVTETQLLLV